MVVCKQVDLTAPAGAEIRLSAQPLSINLSGTATITVVGTREGGAPLPDGTVIRFTVSDNLGAITPNPAETTNGIVTATFAAGTRSGTAVIEAFSGEAISDQVSIDIGEARIARLILTTNPSSLPPEGGTIQLKAFVKDDQGNSVSNVQVFFQTTSGTLASQGDPVLTNSSGVARDTLTTTEDATVTAIAGDQEDQVNISLGTQTGPACNAVAAPTSAAVGQLISFADSSTDEDGGAVETSSWDFGDGSSTNGFVVTHSYDEAGTFIVLHTVVDSQGLSDNCDPIVITVQEGAAPTCDFDVAPTGNVNVGDPVSFVDTSADPDGGTITDSDWEFGDGGQNSGSSVSHTYTSTGSFIVLHTVTDSEGLTSTCTATVDVVFVGTGPTCDFSVAVPPLSSTATLDGSASTDTDENGSSIASWSWNFGDNSAAGSGQVVNHTYGTAGTFNVVLTVTDDEGDSASCTKPVTVPGT